MREVLHLRLKKIGTFSIWAFLWVTFKPVQSPRWALVSSALPNLNRKHYKSVNILSNFQNVKPPCANLSPYSRLSGDCSRLSGDFLATRQFNCIRTLPVWKSKKHANREPNNCNYLGAFYVMCFARVCEIFTAVVSELQRGPHVVL